MPVTVDFAELDILAGDLAQIAGSSEELPALVTAQAAEETVTIVEPILAGVTPERSGALRQSTEDGAQIVPSAEGTAVEFHQPAANPRSGFHYATSRAFGHRIVDRSGAEHGFWTPPEDPVYPVVALDEAMPEVTGALELTATQALVSVIRIAQ